MKSASVRQLEWWKHSNSKKGVLIFSATGVGLLLMGITSTQSLSRVHEPQLARWQSHSNNAPAISGQLPEHFSTGNQFYVAPNGRMQGNGTISDPWDLASALDHPSAIQPGDTVWLRGGVYVGNFVSNLSGTAESPIIVRRYPNERAILDLASVSAAQQPVLKVKGSSVWFWGLEITNSNPDRSRVDPYTGDEEPWRGSGADVYAANVKFINMIFHDNGHGIWDKKDMTEVYGCLFYYNGNNKREHAMYLGNSSGTKHILDNIVFSQGGYGILGYSGSMPDALNGIHIEGNATFNNGILTLDDQATGNIQVGGGMGAPAERIVVKDNFVYNPAGNAISKNCGIRVGYEDFGNKDVKLLNNYIVSKVPLRVWWWQSVEARGNTIYSRNYTTDLRIPEGVSSSSYSWDLNSYLSGRKSGPLFQTNLTTYSFSAWQQEFGIDGSSQVIQRNTLRPVGTQTFVRPNKYEPKRGHLIVYNWDLLDWITVDVSNLGLQIGDTYSVFDVQNYFGGPVASGTYDGSPIFVPLKLSEVSQPVGNVERVPTHTAPEFAVFVLREGFIP